jgi:hypothetical protein
MERRPEVSFQAMAVESPVSGKKTVNRLRFDRLVLSAGLHKSAQPIRWR